MKKFFVLILLSYSFVQAMEKEEKFPPQKVIWDGSSSDEIVLAQESEEKKSLAEPTSASVVAEIINAEIKKIDNNDICNLYNEIDRQNLIKTDNLSQKLLNAIKIKDRAAIGEVLTQVQNEESFDIDNRNAVLSSVIANRCKEMKKQHYVDTLVAALENDDYESLMSAYESICINHTSIGGQPISFSAEEKYEIFLQAYTKLSVKDEKPKHKRLFFRKK